MKNDNGKELDMFNIQLKQTVLYDTWNEQNAEYEIYSVIVMGNPTIIGKLRQDWMTGSYYYELANGICRGHGRDLSLHQVLEYICDEWNGIKTKKV